MSVIASREDVNCFAEYVTQIPQQPFHAKLHALADARRFCSFDAPNEHGKSTQFGVIRPAWEIGKNRNHMIAIYGATERIPVRSVGLVRGIIETNERYHEVFPEIEVVKHSDDHFFVRREAKTLRDPTMFGCGILGDMLGNRSTRIYTDDMLNPRIVTSKALMDTVWFVLTSTILHRLTARGRWVDIGTPWFVDDPRDRLRALPQFMYHRFDAEDMLWPEEWIDDADNLWGWPAWRIEEKRRMTPPSEYNRCFRCIRMSDSMRIFKDGQIQAALNLGRGKRVGRPAPWGIPATTGVDLGTYRLEKTKLEVVDTDLTVLTTGFIAGDQFEILDVRSGRWETSDILNQFHIVQAKYPLHAGFYVEDNGAQIFLLQSATRVFLRALGWTDEEIRRFQVHGLTTTMNKHDPMVGIRGMELPFELGRVVLPSDDAGIPEPEMKLLTDGLAAYRPNPAIHTSDHLMSMWICWRAAEFNAVLRAAQESGNSAKEAEVKRRYGIG